MYVIKHIKYYRMDYIGVPGWLFISAQVMISQFLGLSPALGSMLTRGNCLGFSFSLSSLYMVSFKINKLKKKKRMYYIGGINIVYRNKEE